MGRSMLGEIVDDDERMLAAVAEILGDREAGEWCVPLQPRRSGCRGDDEDATFGRAVLLHRLDDPLDRARALTDRDIDADQVRVFLIDYRIDADRRLAGGTVADDQLALAAPDREQRVNGQDAGLHRLGDEIALDDRRRRPLDRHLRLGLYRLVAIERPSERIDNAAEQSRPHRDLDNLAGSAHPRARLDGLALIEQHRSDRVGIEGQRETHAPAIKPQQLAETGAGQAGHERDPIADAFDAPYCFGLRCQTDASNPLTAAREPGVFEGVR